MKICVIGTGYVGLVTGTCFAETGNQVICVDVDHDKVNGLNAGKIPIFEPGLAVLVKSNHEKGRLKFTTNLAEGVNFADISFIAVGTPPNEDGSADLSHILTVAREVTQVAEKKVVIGTKSTVPVGTGDQIEAIFKDNFSKPFVVFSNPEFLKEGDAVNDFMKPDRIIVGIDNDDVISMIRELYEPFTRQKDRLILMSRRSAEMTKYAANAMLAVRISFTNEMANLCERVGANAEDLRKGIGSDPRIGPAFLYPSMGYGGSCFPKDVKAILRIAQIHDTPLLVIQAANEANQRQKTVMFSKIRTHFGGREKLKGKRFALWGLAFKANTDDIRESPALVLIDDLLEAGAQVTVFDPEAMENARKVYGNRVDYAQDEYDCLKNASALVIATEWNEFRSPDYQKIKAVLNHPVIFDGRNLLNQEHLKKLGFSYYGVGSN